MKLIGKRSPGDDINAMDEATIVELNHSELACLEMLIAQGDDKAQLALTHAAIRAKRLRDTLNEFLDGR